MCEDDASGAHRTSIRSLPDLEPVNRVIGLMPGGEAFEFAVNILNSSELAGACFSPSGRTMFFNLFGHSTVDGRADGGHDLRRDRPVAPRAVVIAEREPRRRMRCIRACASSSPSSSCSPPRPPRTRAASPPSG